jgi:hypothetical protein
MTIGRGEAKTWASWLRALGDPSRILHHLKFLAEVGFVLVDREATSSWWRVNDRCLSCFPSAAEVVMGRVPVGSAPWDEPTTTRRRKR